MNAPTVFVVDDQPSVRHALYEMLSAFGYKVEAHDSADSLLRALGPERHGCVVADVRMPGMDGIELVRELARRQISMPVVLISGHGDVPMAVAAIKVGAEDFIEKPIDDVHLVAAINRSLAGADAQRRLEERVREIRMRFGRLTPREVEVFDLVVQGYTSEAIAERLSISTRTVEGYRVQIMTKMQAESVAVLVRQAIALNRITP
jgi:two-component system response regulator FixJ